MRLTRLEIYGFKSFAKRTEIIFPQNVTGIVGPNGSGKSNISDAVRWVLGEQSAKMLRGNNMADVIFNGTEQRKPMNYCEVTLVFDNADHQLQVDYAEVSITRRVYRSGEGEYQINGAACRLKDIVDMFRDTGVGKEGYSIIGQGRIDEILSQRSEDRRAVFEEAAGISRFKTRKEEAEARLKRADENLVRVVDVLEELQQHLKPLEKQAEVAKEYLALSETLRELDVALFLLRYDRLTQRQATMEQAMLAVCDALTEAGAQLAEATAERDAQEKTVENLQRTLAQAHDALLQKTNLLHAAREKAAAAENRVHSGEETAQRLTAEGDALGARLKLIEATIAQSGGGLAEAETQRAQAQSALAMRRDELAAANQNAQMWEDKLSAHKSAIMDRLNRAANMRAAQARQLTMQSQMTSRRQEIDQQLSDLTGREETLAQALQGAEQSLQAETLRQQALQKETEDFERTTKTLLDGILQKQKETQEAAQQRKAVDARLHTLRELQEGYEGYQYPVKSALARARREGDKGIHDVVAMLLTVPKELETAMDMALGGAMQNIVTQTEQDAKRMIDYLRDNRLGRATFLPLSTVRGRTLDARERAVLSLPGCLGVASELCSFDPKYRDVMESLLGRTVVAEDLESGIRIMREGRHAFRLVTLKGDVMHSGGSMTGGSIQQKAQNLLGREREIKELEQRLCEMDEQLAVSQRALEQMEQERGQIKDRRAQAQYALHQQEIAVARDSEHCKAAKNDLAEHQRTMESLRQAQTQLDESLAQIARELEKTERQTGEDQQSTEEMNRQTEELAQRLNETRRARENAQEAHTQAMLHLQEAEHTLDRLRRDKSRLAGDGDECRKEMEATARKRQEALEQIGRAKRELEEAAQAIELADKQVAAAREQVDALEIDQTAAQKALKDCQNEIEGCQQLVARETERQHRQEMNLARVKADMAQMTDRLWDTYELTYAGAKELHEESCRAKAADAPPFVETEADQKAGEIRDRIRQMGTVNVGAIEEYAQMRERYNDLSGQQGDLEKAKADLQDLITQLLERMRTVFVSQFSLLQGYFEQTFARLFGGGHGEIRLSDPDDPLGCGIEIIVQPPGKKRQILSLFSGGERALTAIAILFAMLMLKPTPFCILDEIEAALDEANITYFADYLKEFSKDTQFIVVTHRKGTMERCDTLFGVAMEEHGVSSMVSVNLTDYQ